MHNPEVFDEKLTTNAYSNTELVNTLIELSESDYYCEIRNFLVEDLDRYSATMTPTLALIRPKQGHGLLKEMLNYLLAKFIYPDTANPVILDSVWRNNPDVLIRGIMTYYTNEPTSESIDHILDAVKEFSDLHQILLDSADYDFTIPFGLASSDRSFINLETWVRNMIENNGDEFVENILSYFSKPNLNTNMENVRVIFDILITSLESFREDLRKTIADQYSALSIQYPELAEPFFSESELTERIQSLFAKIYLGEITFQEFIGTLKGYQTSKLAKENEICQLAILELLEGFPMFYRSKSDKDIRMTARIIGSMIDEKIIRGVFLGVAMKHILDALRQPHEPLQSFGIYVLQEFINRLHEWPKFTSQILLIESLSYTHAEIYHEVNMSFTKEHRMSSSPPKTIAVPPVVAVVPKPEEVQAAA